MGVPGRAEGAGEATVAALDRPRPRPEAPVSTPVTWAEVERGLRIEDFTMANVPARIRKRGDLWAPLLTGTKKGRFRLERLL